MYLESSIQHVLASTSWIALRIGFKNSNRETRKACFKHQDKDINCWLLLTVLQKVLVGKMHKIPPVSSKKFKSNQYP